MTPREFGIGIFTLKGYNFSQFQPPTSCGN
jgi:hypothetical protein